jgi:preprotein translocase subunit SecE
VELGIRLYAPEMHGPNGVGDSAAGAVKARRPIGLAHEARQTGSIETERLMASKTTNPFTFLQQVRTETAKVTWPSRRETMISTAMVLAFAAAAMIFFFAADQLMSYAIELILGIGR